MDLNTIIAITAAMAAIASALAAFVALRPAQRAARAAEEQSVIQRELMEQEAQPYVWADIQADNKQGHLLHLVLGNAGPTMAKNVRVTIDPPISSRGANSGHGDIAQLRLREGILSLAPGRTIHWSLGLSKKFLENENDEDVYQIIVTGDGPYGQLEPQIFQVRPRDWRESLDNPDGSLHFVREEIKALTKAVTELKNAMIDA